MPDNSDEKPTPVSREAQTRPSWFNEVTGFSIERASMCDLGDSANLRFSDSSVNIRANTIHINQLTPESDQSSRPEIPVPTQDGVGFRDEGPQITVVQPRAPTEVPVAQDNGSKDEEPQITLVQPPILQTNSNLSSTLPSDPRNTSELEANVEYTEPVVPLIGSTSHPYTSRARNHIYSFEMLTHREGFPLYMPTPVGGLPTAYRKKGLRIGDVGVITTNGTFDFLFNACQSDPGVNPVSLPDKFELLKSATRTSNKFDPSVCLNSDHVRKRSNDNLSDFQCLAAEGAVLALPKGTTLYEAVNKDHFRSHAARHAISWYKYALDAGRDISNGSLYFVTECIKSVNWGIAVFYAHPIADENLRLIFDEGSCRWVPGDKMETRVGPKPQDMIVSNDEEPNQCVFLRGYKIMLRPDIWKELKIPMSVTSQDGDFSSSQSTRTTSHSMNQGESGSQTDSFHQSSSDNRNTSNYTYGTTVASQLMHTQTLPESPTQGACISGPETLSGWLGQVILEENFREEAPLHPSDLINVMLLHLKPEAKVALAHDSEWCNHLPHDFIADPLDPNVDGLLENIMRSCKVVIDQNESVVLVDNEMESEVETDPFFDLLAHPWGGDQSMYHKGINGEPSMYSGYDNYVDKQLTIGSGLPGCGDFLPSLGSASTDTTLYPFLQLPNQAVGSSAMRIVSNSRRKKSTVFSCIFPGCSANFTSRHNYSYHINSHTGSKPYKCPYVQLGCTYAAAAPRTVKRHRETCKYKPDTQL